MEAKGLKIVLQSTYVPYSNGTEGFAVNLDIRALGYTIEVSTAVNHVSGSRQLSTAYNILDANAYCLLEHLCNPLLDYRK